MPFQTIRKKMVGARIARPAIRSFLAAVSRVRSTEHGTIPECAIDPVHALPRLEDIAPQNLERLELLSQLAVVKLNGGLGTSMGLDKAKSLLVVRRDECLLDFIARHILQLREESGSKAPAFYLMNSFGTRKDSLRYLKRYPSLGSGGPIDFLQSMVPKICATTHKPISWPENPNLEWCPPGHGDLYTTMWANGLLENLLRAGVKFMFVSNADNVGASVDMAILRYFSDSGISFLMEVTKRTSADRKGGHLAQAKSNKRLLLREVAQCPEEDLAAFQDIDRHSYFNTNNLWIRLDHLKERLDDNGGELPLPIIANRKTIDPKDAKSPKILQLESAMGAAIECFDRAGALVVPRARFAPVKTTADLLALRSDVYWETGNGCLVLNPSRCGRPPLIDLSADYKHILDFENAFPDGSPSLLNCKSLKILGKWVFGTNVICEGDVEFVNFSPETRQVAPGRYRDKVLTYAGEKVLQTTTS